MGRYCSDCANFNTKDKKAPGYCKCKKTKKKPADTERYMCPAISGSPAD